MRKADQDGDISFKGRCIRLGKPFRGMSMALRPAGEDGTFTVHFCTHQVGFVDLRKAPSACGRVDIARAMPTSPQANSSNSKSKTRQASEQPA